MELPAAARDSLHLCHRPEGQPLPGSAERLGEDALHDLSTLSQRCVHMSRRPEYNCMK